MSQSGRDLRYGRRGGHWLPDGYVPTVAVPCEVCGEPTISDDRMHLGCRPAVEVSEAPPSLF